jgi:hypothetical protein
MGSALTSVSAVGHRSPGSCSQQTHLESPPRQGCLLVGTESGIHRPSLGQHKTCFQVGPALAAPLSVNLASGKHPLQPLAGPHKSGRKERCATTTRVADQILRARHASRSIGISTQGVAAPRFDALRPQGWISHRIRLYLAFYRPRPKRT